MSFSKDLPAWRQWSSVINKIFSVRISWLNG
jgi:hypothetical protein